MRPGEMRVQRHAPACGAAVVFFLLMILSEAVPAAAVTEVPVQATEGEAAPAATAQPLGEAPVLLIMDASGSMNADDGTGQPKIEAARQALTQLIDGLPDNATVGLRAYGHRTPNTDREAGCADTELLVPVGADNRDALRQAVGGLQASGFTPIGTSLRAALEDLPGDTQRTVILVSDGIDTCAPPAACEVARQIIAEGVQLRVETVGFQVDAAAAQELQCIADATGGTFRPADSAEDLARELRANIASGIPVEGGPTPAQATLIGPGQYVDVLRYPMERWYAVDLRPGDRVRSTAAVIGSSTTPQVPSVRIEMQLGFGDIIGLTPCDTDSAVGVGPFTQNLAVDGLQVEGGTVCSDPGRYVIGLKIAVPDDTDVERAMEGVELPVELFVAVTNQNLDAPVTPGPARPDLAAPPPIDPGRLPTPTSYYLITVVGFGALGTIAGVALSRRMRP